LDKEKAMASEEKDRTTQKIKALGIAYRVMLILGLILFVATAILAILTVRITVWYLTLPVAIFISGIILARLEYNLFRRS
jgi:hypothetical protein